MAYGPVPSSPGRGPGGWGGGRGSPVAVLIWGSDPGEATGGGGLF